MSNLTNLGAIKNPDNESLLQDTGKFRFLADRTRYDLLNTVGELACGGDKAPSDLHVMTKNRVYLSFIVFRQGD